MKTTQPFYTHWTPPPPTTQDVYDLRDACQTKTHTQAYTCGTRPEGVVDWPRLMFISTPKPENRPRSRIYQFNVGKSPRNTKRG